jgi:hypothetical protein
MELLACSLVTTTCRRSTRRSGKATRIGWNVSRRNPSGRKWIALAAVDTSCTGSDEGSVKNGCHIGRCDDAILGYGGTVITRYVLRELLDKLDELLP